MKAVASVLTAQLEVVTTNEPINRELGNIDQANLEAETAKELREAISEIEAETDQS